MVSSYSRAIKKGVVVVLLLGGCGDGSGVAQDPGGGKLVVEELAQDPGGSSSGKLMVVELPQDPCGCGGGKLLEETVVSVTFSETSSTTWMDFFMVTAPCTMAGAATWKVKKLEKVDAHIVLMLN